MHAVKRRARRLAWRREQGGMYNPFGLSPLASTPTRDLKDLESGEQRTWSEPPMMGPTENDELEPVSPRHPKTMAARIPTQFRNPTSAEVEPVATTDDSNDAPRATESADIPALLHPPTANGREGKMKRRLPFLRKEDNEKPTELQQTKSSTSTQKQDFTLMKTFRATILRSWINVLLICVPVGIAIHYVKSVNRIAVFVINFLAIIPLAGLLSYATEEIAMRTGETLGGLLNASFGNAVELIVSIIALVADQIIIVKTSLIGSMLSNLLLVMGMCFFFGGLNRIEQFFNVVVAQTASSLLALAVGSIIIPTVFRDWSTPGSTPAQLAQRKNKTTPLSRGVAVILLVIYGCYLFFQLKTHTKMYNETGKKASKRKSGSVDTGAARRGIAMVGASNAGAAGDGVNQAIRKPDGEDDEEDEQPQISLISAGVTLCIATAFVGICAQFMVDGIGVITTQGNISPEFVGLILIPIVGNAAEHATALTVACKDKMDLAIGVAVGSSLQIALLVLPLAVVVGWGLGKETMNLSFDGFLITVLFVAVLLVNYLIGDGRSHWMEGALLMALYIIIAVAAWFYPAGTSVVG